MILFASFKTYILVVVFLLNGQPVEVASQDLWGSPKMCDIKGHDIVQKAEAKGAEAHYQCTLKAKYPTA